MWQGRIPAPGDGAPLSPLRGSGVTEDEKGMLRLLPLWGLEYPLSEGEREPNSPPSPPLLFSGSSGARPSSPSRLRLPRPSIASSRLSSRPPFPNNNEDRSVLSVPLQTPVGPRGELWALGELRDWGGEGWGGYGEFMEFGVRSCHTGGEELQERRLWIKGKQVNKTGCVKSSTQMVLIYCSTFSARDLLVYRAPR